MLVDSDVKFGTKAFFLLLLVLLLYDKVLIMFCYLNFAIHFVSLAYSRFICMLLGLGYTCWSWAGTCTSV